MAGFSVRRAALSLLSLVLLVLPALGLGVVIGPESIEDRNPISLTLSDVMNGDALNVTLTATYIPSPGTTWLNLTNWNYPFDLQGGRAVVTARNVNRVAFLVREGTTLMTQRGSGAGNITLEIPVGFHSMTYYDFRVGYELHDPAAPLTLTIVQMGTKEGLEQDAVLTPSVLGMAGGNLTVEILANGSLQGSGDIRVLAEAPLPLPGEENITATPTPSETLTTPEPATTTSVPVSTPEDTHRATPPPTPSPAPETPAVAGPSPWVLAYGAVVVILSLIADYFILRD